MEADALAEEEAAGAWSRVDLHSEKPPDIAAGKLSVALQQAEGRKGGGFSLNWFPNFCPKCSKCCH